MKTFARHLFVTSLVALHPKGIHTFKDAEKLERGKSISPDLMREIEESRIVLIILSKNYANSTWCIRGIKQRSWNATKQKGQIVLPGFYGKDPSIEETKKKTAIQKHIPIMKAVSWMTRCKNGASS